jgi:hypothetical protein
MAKMRILDNDYKLVNQADPTQSIIVHRKTQEFGPDRIKPKDDTDTWKRTFLIINENGISRFKGAPSVTLHQKNGDEMPYMTDSDGNMWILEEIPEPAKTVASAPTDGSKRKGRPPGAKNKQKEIVDVPAPEAEPVITSVAETPADSASIAPVAEIQIPAEPVNEQTVIMADGTTP